MFFIVVFLFLSCMDAAALRPRFLRGEARDGEGLGDYIYQLRCYFSSCTGGYCGALNDYINTNRRLKKD